jgi:GT2 family glycosyltransferase
MAKTKTVIVIPTYNGVDRLRFMLQTIRQNDPSIFGRVPILVVEDPCGKEGVSTRYAALTDEFPDIDVAHLHEWSNMHGAAKKAFDLAFGAFDPEWVIYLGDDLAVTPNALSSLVYFIEENPLKTVSLVGIPYWNSHDLCKSEDSEWDGPKLFWRKEDFYGRGLEWTKDLPRNPHWDGDGIARSYVNVNGAGFACKAETYRKVGGFATGTWCLDESISVRTWLNSDQSIVCLPGPPFVHYFGGATPGHHAVHDLHTEERWIEAMGMTKHEAGVVSYAKMHEREAAVKEEMQSARYWSE